MRHYAAYILLLCAISAGVFALWGDQGFRSLKSLQRSVEANKEKNGELRDKVESLKREVYGLQKDDRQLEKAARNELGMARSNELTLIFDQSLSEQSKP